MSDLKEYTVIIAGIEHTVLLSSEDAELRSAVPVKVASAKNKAVKAAPNKGA